MILAMPDPVFPIDFTTVYVAVLLAGGTLLALTFATALGFILLRRYFAKGTAMMAALDTTRRPSWVPKDHPGYSKSGKRL